MPGKRWDPRGGSGRTLGLLVGPHATARPRASAASAEGAAAEPALAAPHTHTAQPSRLGLCRMARAVGPPAAGHATPRPAPMTTAPPMILLRLHQVLRSPFVLYCNLINCISMPSFCNIVYTKPEALRCKRRALPGPLPSPGCGRTPSVHSHTDRNAT